MPKAIPIIIALDPAVAGTAIIHSCIFGIERNAEELN